MRKRLLSTLLVLCIVLTLFPGIARATDSSGTCGENVTWAFSDGTLTIQGTGNMENYTFPAFGKPYPWEKYIEQIHTVKISDGVTGLGSYAFFSCKSLTSVTIPNSVTAIGGSAFYNCSSLASVTIPNSVTIIGAGAFSDCSNLLSVAIPNRATFIGHHAFYNCSSLTSMVIPDSVTSIGEWAFSHCSSLISVTLGKGLNSIEGQTFDDCTSLNSMVIPDSVTSIGQSAFRDCSSLTDITIPNSVITIGDGAFSGCSSLTSVIIPSNVTNIEGFAFFGCSSLTSVTIPDSVTSIVPEAFDSCNSLTDVYYSGSEADWAAIGGEGKNDLIKETITVHYNSTETNISLPNSVIESEPNQFPEVSEDLNTADVSPEQEPSLATSIPTVSTDDSNGMGGYVIPLVIGIIIAMAIIVAALILKNKSAKTAPEQDLTLSSPSLEHSKAFKFCPRCGEKVSIETNFCPKCGEQLQKGGN